MGVDHGGPDIAVTEKCLDGTDVVISLKKMSGVAVAEGMGSDTLGESGAPEMVGLSSKKSFLALLIIANLL